MASQNQFQLLAQRRFGPFFLTQFLGAFNDNVFKNALIILLSFRALTLGGEDHSSTLINLSAGLFILPFFLFSATAGQIADKYEKARLIRGIKALEILIMAGAALAFIIESVPLLIALLFAMGTQSALFGPLKYAVLPQYLADSELIGGTGMVEMGTFVAILTGTLVGGALIGVPDDGPLWVAAVLIAVASSGYLASRAIPPAAAAAPDLRIDWNPLTETARNLRFLHGNRTVFQSVLGISWFWFFGATYLTQLPNYTRLALNGNEQVVTLLLALFSVGIGAGSLLCEKMAGGRVELGLVPFGSIGLTVFGLDLFFAAPSVQHGGLMGAAAFLAVPGAWRVVADIVLIGVFGGFYIVPLYALVQQRSAPAHRSRVIAGNNILNALMMVAASIAAIGLLAAGLSVPQLLVVTALMNAAVAMYIYLLVPEFLLRFMAWILTHTMYRIRKAGLENVPSDGAAVLVCNHVSFADAVVIAGVIPRPVRFVMDHKIYRAPVLNYFFRKMRAIPIASARTDAALLQQAYDEISRALRSGQLVCIFPEGQITRTGQLNAFRKGVEQIIARDPVPVVPMALRGLWGSFFSRKNSDALLPVPRRFWSRIGLVIGRPVSPDAVTAEFLENQVMELRGEEP